VPVSVATMNEELMLDYVKNWTRIVWALDEVPDASAEHDSESDQSSECGHWKHFPKQARSSLLNLLLASA
jgi:hypothetical protein